MKDFYQVSVFWNRVWGSNLQQDCIPFGLWDDTWSLPFDFFQTSCGFFYKLTFNILAWFISFMFDIAKKACIYHLFVFFNFESHCFHVLILKNHGLSELKHYCIQGNFCPVYFPPSALANSFNPSWIRPNTVLFN